MPTTDRAVLVGVAPAEREREQEHERVHFLGHADDVEVGRERRDRARRIAPHAARENVPSDRWWAADDAWCARNRQHNQTGRAASQRQSDAVEGRGARATRACKTIQTKRCDKCRTRPPGERSGDATPDALVETRRRCAAHVYSYGSNL